MQSQPSGESNVRAGADAQPETIDLALSASSPPKHALRETRYRAVRFHAKGGLGEVHVALDSELQREVALKRIQDRYAHDPNSRYRFLREAAITARLEHPGIVPVYGLVQDAEGQPSYAMRFIEGESLQDAIARYHTQTSGNPAESGLALRQLLSRYISVCNTIAYAHSRGFVHRDLKPRNIMLGKYGETLVVDWGLAKSFAQAEASQGSEDKGLVSISAFGTDAEGTVEGQAIGTPAYMSPEQAAGQLDLLGPASDIYSLGATLYTLLTGYAPFRGLRIDQVLSHVQQGKFPRPRQISRAIPRALEAICLKAMALRPADRYGTAQELAGDVEHWLADERVSAYREPIWIPIGRRLKRHKGLIPALAAVVTASFLWLMFGAWFATYAPRRNAEEQFRKEEKLWQDAEYREKQRQGHLAAREVFSEIAKKYGTSRLLGAKFLTPEAVAKKVGEKCTVEMVVKSTGNSRGLFFLDSRPDYRDADNFTIFINREGVESLKEAKIDDPAAHYKNKTVRVTGVVKLYRDKPEIVVEKADQIEVVEQK